MNDFGLTGNDSILNFISKIFIHDKYFQIQLISLYFNKFFSSCLIFIIIVLLCFFFQFMETYHRSRYDNPFAYSLFIKVL